MAISLCASRTEERLVNRIRLNQSGCGSEIEASLITLALHRFSENRIFTGSDDYSLSPTPPHHKKQKAKSKKQKTKNKKQKTKSKKQKADNQIVVSFLLQSG